MGKNGNHPIFNRSLNEKKAICKMSHCPVRLVTLVNPGQSRLNEKVVTFAVKNPFQHPIVGLFLAYSQWVEIFFGEIL